jgi:hypothetical protein
MQGQIINVPFEYVVAIVLTLASALGAVVGAVIFLFSKNESKHRTIVDLTKSFTEVTKDHGKALENNTKVIERMHSDMVMINATQARKK